MLFGSFILSVLAPLALAAEGSNSAATKTSSPAPGSNSPYISVATKTDGTTVATYSVGNAAQFSTWGKELNKYLSSLDIPPAFSQPTATLNISIAQSLRGPVMTAVPASVILGLIGKSYRDSVKAEFRSGNPPEWYKTMDKDAKEFFEGFASSLKAGKTAIFAKDTSVTQKTTAAAPEETKTDEEDAAVRVLDGAVMLAVFGAAALTSMLLAL